MEGAAVSQRGCARRESVEAGRVDIHAVIEPLARNGPADIISTAGIERCLDVHTGVAVLPSVIRGVRIMVSDPFAAVVEVFGLNEARERTGGAAKRGRRE